jgi:hypothetical protein
MAQREQRRRHVRWLRQIEPEAADRQLVVLAQQVYHALWRMAGHRLPVPKARSRSDGQLFYCWDSPRYHIEVQFNPEPLGLGADPIELFCRDREATGDFVEQLTSAALSAVFVATVPELVAQADALRPWLERYLADRAVAR